MGGAFTGVIIVVAVIVPIGLTLFILWKVLGGLHKEEKEKERLLASGLPAAGRIMQLQPTGQSVTVMGHRHLRLAFAVEVQIPGRPAYPAQFQQLISELQIPSIQPGSTVQLRVDPANPMTMVIAGSGPAAGGLPGAAVGGFGAAAPAAGGFGGPPPGAPGGFGAQPPGAPSGFGAQPPGAPGGYGMQAPGAPAGYGMQPGMAMATPNIGGATKKIIPMMIIIFAVTTIPIAAIMIFTFVDFSSVTGGADAPKGGYCEAATRCCKVISAGAGQCDNWSRGGMPVEGCKRALEGYKRSAQAQGKSCK